MRTLVALGSMLLLGCTPSVDAPSTADAAGTVGAPCNGFEDCVAPAICGYALDGGCDAQGVCVHVNEQPCTDGPVVCACDGTPLGLTCVLPAGYGALPVPSKLVSCAPDAGGD